MPDHIHVMLSGVREEADLLLAGRFMRKHLGPLLVPAHLQKQAYDHVLREEERRDEAFAKVCHYILENPVRAGLCGKVVEYEFSGGVIPGFPDLRVHEVDYWDLYWRVHHRLTTAATREE